MAYLDKDGTSRLWSKVKALFNKGVTGISVSGRTITITKGDGSTSTQTTQDTTYSKFKGATASADGGNGLVPAPTKGNEGKYLKADGTWGTPANTTYSVVSKTAPGLAPQLPDETSTTKYLRQDGTWVTPPNTTYNDATQSAHGLMSTADKTKLDGIESGAQKNANAFGTVLVGDASHKYDAGSVGAAVTFKAKGDATVELVNPGQVVIGAKSYSKFTSSSDGLVPAASVDGDVLTQNGWGILTLEQSEDATLGRGIDLTLDDVPIGGVNIPYASTSVNGLLKKEMYSKLEGLPTGTYISDTYAKKTDIAGMYQYKGSVADASKLPTTGQKAGDVYNIESSSVYGGAGMNVAWDGSKWDPLGEIFTITSITNAEIDAICV